jgi:hypothetical protein
VQARRVNAASIDGKKKTSPFAEKKSTPRRKKVSTRGKNCCCDISVSHAFMSRLLTRTSQLGITVRDGTVEPFRGRSFFPTMCSRVSNCNRFDFAEKTHSSQSRGTTFIYFAEASVLPPNEKYKGENTK